MTHLTTFKACGYTTLQKKVFKNCGDKTVTATGDSRRFRSAIPKGRRPPCGKVRHSESRHSGSLSHASDKGQNTTFAIMRSVQAVRCVTIQQSGSDLPATSVDWCITSRRQRKAY